MSLPPNEPGHRAAPHGPHNDPGHAAPSDGAGYPAAGYQPGNPAPADYGPGGYPSAGGPTSQFPAASPPIAKRSKAVPILATLTVLLLLALAGMTALFLVNKNDADKKVATQQSQIETLQRDAKAKSDELTKVNQDLTTAKGKADSSAACIKAVQDFFRAVKANNEAAGTRATIAVDRDCEGVDLI
jgi:hypothetical protein